MPILTDHIKLIVTLFGLFKQSRREQQDAKQGRLFTNTVNMPICASASRELDPVP